MKNKLVDNPKLINVEKGHRYSLCPCGKSQKYPLCDGAHKGSGIKSMKYEASFNGVIQFENNMIKVIDIQ